MWPLYPLSSAILGTTITSSFISCSWVEQISSKYMLKAYIKQPHQDYEIMNGVMYNASKIKQVIQQFLHNYNLHNAYAVLAIENAPSRQVIMQYQLLAISISLNCIMITSHDSVYHAIPNSCSLSNACNIEKDEALYAIGLYTLGKNCERTT